jgi:hypothetical protein
VASDLHPAPWNTLAADAGRLPLAAQSVDAVVGLDVLHHLAAPADFFRESRARHRGDLVLVSPGSAFSWPPVVHQEVCRLSWTSPQPAAGHFEGDAPCPEDGRTGRALEQLGLGHAARRPPERFRLR